MKDAIEPTKIVSLSQRSDSPERLGDLLHAVRDTASRKLQKLLGNMFEHVDDALFDLAEKAENNAAQMHYFDGMREVRKRRPAVERSYLAQFSRGLSDFAANRRAASAEAPPVTTGGVELSLVADNELEESLAITSMISKNEARLTRELFAVNQRLGVICGGIKVDDANNPVGPGVLTQTFRQAMRELAADMRVKLIIYKLFDRYVLSGLEELYQELNVELVRAGVLPQLRREIARGTAARGAASRGPAGSDAADGTGIDGAAEDAGNLLHTLHALFSARRGQPNGSLGGGAAPGPQTIPTANELLGALSVLQSQIATDGSLPNYGDASGADIAHEVAQLKEQLFNQIGSLRGERPHHVSSIDEDTIDLVSMLFEFILEDRNLPAQMQVMLARLQIPYLKAAILDRRLFAHRQHPARRLLDSLADVAKGWSEESDKDRRLHDKVKSIVEQLLHDFDDDMGIFERLAVDLQEFQELTRKRAELAEQRVAESTRGREKLEQARRRAAREILDRIDGKPLPPLIHGVLARAWANYLVLILLRQGDGSPEFADGLRFVNELIASTRLAGDEEGRATLRQMLPGIERALRRGLANVAFQEDDVERLLTQLQAYYRQQLGEAPAAPADASPIQAPPAIPESVQSIVESVPEPAPAVELEAEESLAILPPEVREQMATVGAMKPGVWVEFCPAEGAVERAKLSWISPMSGRYLFVNRRGLKVGDYSPPELAASFADGTARLLASNAFFDRAMDAIVGRLSQPAADNAEHE
ncbi:DUF1631 domain-containing protein [Dyella sp.]|jgi:hypothetical protein|uniref:DUF1631 domain-containing protein n=1 Tax=Dyella sp. TaxID=1869338 RepID=UPI002D78C2A8|nr:DUF1631 domain-containing protein [Dyella sp.]HET6432130.1 DUF1631 domain-containing protein [Dyella sp.]